MLNYPIQNISNLGKTIVMFCRQKDGILTIRRDITFSPYFYQLSPAGIYRTIDNKKVNKIICRHPGEVSKKRDNDSYEADVLYCKRYLIDKITEIIPSQPKYLFIDVEIQTDRGIPDYNNPNQMITCISIYNSYSKETKTFWIKDYKKEVKKDEETYLLEDFVHYIQKEQPDLLLGWNFTQFDYPYLSKRMEKLWGLNLAETISPINKVRYGLREVDIPYPCGISILDYLDLFKKIYNRELSYALENVSQKYLNTEPQKKVDFSKISEEIKEKNIQDIKKMVMLEEKLKIISYYDEIRRMGKCLWEDLTWHSKVLDVMLLTEAKKMGVVLPSKNYNKEWDSSKPITLEDVFEQEFEGAYRHADLGRFIDIYKLDLGSAYPQAIINFCLDISNLTDNENEHKIDITDRVTNETKYSIYVKQNPNTLLPTIARKLIAKKDILKKQLKTLDPESEEGKDLQIKYDATKSLVNSLFGVCALRVFRLYNVHLASAITSIIRDLLRYVEDELQERGMKVTYVDTDSIFVYAKEDPKDLLNHLVNQWAKEKHNKNYLGIEFDCEGIYEKLLVVALCHYIGYLKTKSGIKKEIKGVEVKRKDSSIFMKNFQEELIDKILDGYNHEAIIAFIKSKIEAIKSIPLQKIAFPAKLNNQKEYKSPPIFQRAVEYSRELNPNFNPQSGELFYYIYVIPFGKAERHSKQMRMNKDTGERELRESHTMINKNVLAFQDNTDYIKEVDWKRMIKRNIIDKAEHIFEAMQWDFSEIKSKKERTSRKKNESILEEKHFLNKEDKENNLEPYYSEQ